MGKDDKLLLENSASDLDLIKLITVWMFPFV